MRHARRPAPKPTRCDYCQRKPAVVLSWPSSYSSMGQRKALTVFAASCAEHENCANFQGNIKLHPEARHERCPKKST